MRRRNTKYLQRFKGIIKGIAEKHGLDEHRVVEVIDHFFYTMNRFITDPRMPTIKITNFGTFKPTIGRMNGHIKMSINAIRKGKNVERNKAKIRHLWQIRRRLIEEKHGAITWKIWRNKEIDITYTKRGKNAKKQDKK